MNRNRMLPAAALLLFTLTDALAQAPLAKRVDDYLKPYIEHHVFSGVVLIASGDDVRFEKAYGMANYEFGVPNTPETRFGIASISKRFTGIIIQQLTVEKKLSLDDRLAKWVPDFPKADRITVEQLLMHRSGIRDPETLRRKIRMNYTTGDVVDVLKTQPLGSEPGAEYSYTTANYAVLAHIIERVTGKSYPDVVRERVYLPAGMRDSGELATTTVVPRLASGYAPDPFSDAISVSGFEDSSWKVGGGASYSTARDLLRFSRALYAGKLLRGVAPSDYFRHSTVLGHRAFSSSGAFPGVNANLLVFPDDGMTVVVLSNSYASVSSTIAEDCAALAFGIAVPSPAVKLADVKMPFDPRLAGLYRVEGKPWKFTIALHAGVPFVSWSGGGRDSAMLRIDAETWFLPLDWARLKIHFDDHGTADASLVLGSETMKVVMETAGPKPVS